jgi:chaperone required for assembly of F1-ATPase
MSWIRRRFYRAASIARAPEGFTVTLDDRPIRTPAGTAMVLPTEGLARAIADEWQAQEETILPHTMPLTQLAATAVDRIVPQRDAVLAQVASYASSELLCYRAGDPPDLVRRQEAMWQPLLDWLAEAFGATLRVTAGVVPIAQPTEAIGALRAAADELSDMELTALACVMQSSGSLTVALAMVAGHIDADAAFAISQLEETYEIERWGEDEEASRRRDRIREEIRSAAAFLALARARCDQIDPI